MEGSREIKEFSNMEPVGIGKRCYIERLEKRERELEKDV